VPVVRVPMLTGTDNINSGSVDYSKFGLLIDPSNIIVGWHRIVKTEQWRDPREGVTSLIISCRVDVKLAVPDMGVLVYNNNIVVS
jgi:hypothetical protein